MNLPKFILKEIAERKTIPPLDYGGFDLLKTKFAACYPLEQIPSIEDFSLAMSVLMTYNNVTQFMDGSFIVTAKGEDRDLSEGELAVIESKLL